MVALLLQPASSQKKHASTGNDGDLKAAHDMTKHGFMGKFQRMVWVLNDKLD